MVPVIMVLGAKVVPIRTVDHIPVVTIFLMRLVVPMALKMEVKDVFQNVLRKKVIG